MSNFPWKGQKEAFQQSLNYLKGRQLGHIRSIKTPWPKLDDAAVNGLEWHTMIVLAGRPGSGKTLIKDQLIRSIFPLNPAEKMRVLEFSLEMRGMVSATREFSSVIGKSYKYLCSAESNTLTGNEFVDCFAYAKERIKYPIDVIEDAPTVEEFKKIVIQYMETYAVMVGGVKVYTNTFVTLDHSLLLKRNQKTEKDKTEMLYNLGEAITFLKRRYPITFIILSQLNRGIEDPERNEDGRYGNYILESDVFGGDALLQHTDILIGINKPAKQNINYYGPERYIIESKQVLVWHFLKVRNGDPRMSFFKAEFEKMKVSEMLTPGTQAKRLSSK